MQLSRRGGGKKIRFYLSFYIEIIRDYHTEVRLLPEALARGLIMVEG